MTVFRLQTEIASDSTLPRDGIVITPHFDDRGLGSDPAGLCDDLAAAIHTWLGKTRQIRIKAYDAQGAVPVFPVAETIINPGAAPAFVGPREVAVCLSFYSVNNVARKRGRVYVPWGAMNVTPADLIVRPSSAVRDQVAQLAPIFANLGGVDVDWSIYSRVDDVARPVTNWWVDDEWDTVRSRGLRAITRTEGTTSEA